MCRVIGKGWVVPMSLASRVRELRLAKGFSQKDLAERVGIERSYIGHIESGKTQLPSREVLAALAKALDTDVQDLLVAAGYLPRRDDQDLPDFHMYLSRRFHNNPKLQRALIAAYEAMLSIQEERGERANTLADEIEKTRRIAEERRRSREAQGEPEADTEE